MQLRDHAAGPQQEPSTKNSDLVCHRVDDLDLRRGLPNRLAHHGLSSDGLYVALSLADGLLGQEGWEKVACLLDLPLIDGCFSSLLGLVLSFNLRHVLRVMATWRHGDMPAT